MTARDFFYRPDGALRAPWRLAGFIALLAVVLRVLSLAASPAARGMSLLAKQAIGFWVLLAGLVIAHGIMLRWVDHAPWSTVGLGRRQASPGRLATGFALGALCILVPSVGLLSVHWLRPVSAGGNAAAWWSYAAVMFGFFLPQSLAEEMLVRGYVFRTLRDGMGDLAALLVTSAVFGALHLANPGVDAQSVMLVVLAGVFLGTILLITDSLWAAWMAHFAWNWAMAALLHTAVSGITVPAPDYRVIDAGPDWATGGTWGPEGGVGAAVGMLAGLLILVAWRRRRATLTTEMIETNG
ncbi:MAG TPA: type II CAAX endopeptidase family protein [Gemmatimonadaceae bacterium]|nr:type II CAAX endopeptidase family protein [Gemmatimonadaceae bacterium]